MSGGNLQVTSCGSEDWNNNVNLIRVGHPSCITDVYTKARYDFNYPHNIIYTRTISSCANFSPYSICFSTYAYCFDENGIEILIKKYDGSSSIICPPNAEILVDATLTPPSGYMVLNCYPVCNYFPNNATGIADVSLLEQISPNPTSNYLDVVLSNVCEKIIAEVVDLEGKSLFIIEFENKKDFRINFPINLPNGIYSLLLNVNNKRSTTNFIISK